MDQVDSTKNEFVMWKGLWNSVTFDGVGGTIQIPLRKKYNNVNYETEAIVTYENCEDNNQIESTECVYIKFTISSNILDTKNTYSEYIGNMNGNEIECSVSFRNGQIRGIYKCEDIGIIELKPIDTIIDDGQKFGWCVLF